MSWGQTSNAGEVNDIFHPGDSGCTILGTRLTDTGPEGRAECDRRRANPPQPLASLLEAHTPLQKATHHLTLLNLPVSNLYLRGIMDRIFWVLIIVSSTLSHFILMRGVIIITLKRSKWGSVQMEPKFVRSPYSCFHRNFSTPPWKTKWADLEHLPVELWCHLAVKRALRKWNRSINMASHTAYGSDSNYHSASSGHDLSLAL